MIGAFLAFGTSSSLAILAVLSYRLISFWLPTVPGAAAYLQLRRTVGRWRHETTSASRNQSRPPGRPHIHAPAEMRREDVEFLPSWNCTLADSAAGPRASRGSAGDRLDHRGDAATLLRQPRLPGPLARIDLAAHSPATSASTTARTRPFRPVPGSTLRHEERPQRPVCGKKPCVAVLGACGQVTQPERSPATSSSGPHPHPRDRPWGSVAPSAMLACASPQGAVARARATKPGVGRPRAGLRRITTTPYSVSATSGSRATLIPFARRPARPAAGLTPRAPRSPSPASSSTTPTHRR